MFLRWEDIIRKDFARPAWWKIVNMYRSYSGVASQRRVSARIVQGALALRPVHASTRSC